MNEMIYKMGGAKRPSLSRIQRLLFIMNKLPVVHGWAAKQIKKQFSNVQKITSAEKLRSRAFDEIVPFRKFIIKDDTSALL